MVKIVVIFLLILYPTSLNSSGKNINTKINQNGRGNKNNLEKKIKKSMLPVD